MFYFGLAISSSRFHTFPALTSHFKQINSQIIRLREDKRNAFDEEYFLYKLRTMLRARKFVVFRHRLYKSNFHILFQLQNVIHPVVLIGCVAEARKYRVVIVLRLVRANSTSSLFMQIKFNILRIVPCCMMFHQRASKLFLVFVWCIKLSNPIYKIHH